MKCILACAFIAIAYMQCTPLKTSIIAGWQPPIPDSTDTTKAERYWYSRIQDLHLQDNAIKRGADYVIYYLYEPKDDLRYTEKGDTSFWPDAVLIAELKPTQAATTVKVMHFCKPPEKKFL